MIIFVKKVQEEPSFDLPVCPLKVGLIAGLSEVINHNPCYAP